MKTIKQLREERGLSLRQMAEATGIDHMAIHHWENDRHMPRADQLRRVAEFFGVKSDTITLPDVPDRRRRALPVEDHP